MPPGQGWREEGRPARQPHEYIRGDTAKLFTLFHPSTGELRAKGVTSSANAILHPWLEQELDAVMAGLPVSETAVIATELNRQQWQKWQADLSIKFTLPETLPPLRALLILDVTAQPKTDFGA